jgi:hypothetical protein
MFADWIVDFWPISIARHQASKVHFNLSAGVRGLVANVGLGSIATDLRLPNERSLFDPQADIARRHCFLKGNKARKISTNPDLLYSPLLSLNQS